MLKKITISLLLLVNLYALEEKYQINAKNLDTKNDIVVATGNVVIFSKTYFMSANKAIYDKQNNTFELFDDVVILKDNILQAQSNYAFVNMENESMIQNPALFLNKPSSLWINSQASQKTEDTVNLESSILSSCDCEDPFWSIRFSNGDYDTKEQWINTFNTRLYIKNVPVFYTPYFGFSTDKTRRTGLLYPKIGYSSSDGFIYAQPFYYAPADNYDIELMPQIRTQRGEGIHGYFRYADSPYSMLRVESGIFVEQSEYFEAENLKNKKHFGWNVDYQRTKLFAENENHQDGLYLNANWLNDIDYAEIENVRFGDNDNRRIESKLNYFYKTPEYYAGTYLRYYLETPLESNDTVIQQLPQVQLHQFTKPIIWDNLLYSTDLRYTNYSRKVGLNAQQYDLTVPIYYSFSLFDDYLRVTLKEEISLSRLEYTNGVSEFNNGTFMQTRHVVEVGTDLLKPYENYLHTVNFNTELAIPNSVRTRGDLYSLTNNDTELAPFTLPKDNKTLTFALNQSLYDREDLKQIVNHKIKQAILYDDFDNSTLGDLENEVTFNYILGSIYNRIIYSNQDHTLVESSSGFDFNYEWFAFKANHYMSKDTENSGKDELESYMLAATARMARDYWLTYRVHYNLIDDIKSKEALIFTINDKCWRLNVNFEKRLEPTHTNRGHSIKSQDVIYLEIELKPLGGIQQTYSLGDN
ncbi:MAG: LPS-assembly protein LptD [Arcobacteraceae bacterium]